LNELIRQFVDMPLPAVFREGLEARAALRAS
jgi:hypothetical protein